MTIKFVHIRKPLCLVLQTTSMTSLDTEIWEPKGISNLGGATIAYEWLSEIDTEQGDVLQEFIVSVSKCSDKDNFCKKTGRAIAAGRLKSPKQSQVFLADSISELVERVRKEYNL